MSPSPFDATFEYLVVRKTDTGVVHVQLNRPQLINGFNRAMRDELVAVLTECGKDDTVRAVLLSGAGRGFCSGQDLGEVPPGDLPDLTPIVREGYNRLVTTIRNLPLPVVCAVHGMAAGAGANLALVCDVVLAANDATFIQAFSKIGLVPDTGGTFILPRLVGWGRASGMMMLADKVSGEEAARMGMIYRAVPAEDLENEARAVAERLAAAPTRALALTKELLNGAMGTPWAEQLDAEAAAQGQAGHTSDFIEGVKSFREKRPPVFRGA